MTVQQVPGLTRTDPLRRPRWNGVTDPLQADGLSVGRVFADYLLELGGAS